MLAENFPDLEKLYGVGPLSGYLGGQQLDAARESQRINQQSALQDMYWQNQKEPVDMDYKKALTGQAQETTRGMVFKNDMNDRTKEQQYRAAMSKLAAESKADDVKMLHSQLESFLANPTASEEMKKQATWVLQHTKEILAEQAKQQFMADRQKEVEEIRGRTQGQVAQIRANGSGANKPLTMSQFRARMEERAAQGDEDAINWIRLEQARQERLKAAGAMITDARVKALLDENNTGGTPIGQPQPAPNAKKAPTNVQEAKEAGWVLSIDGNKNQAYVSPDGKSFIEVK